MISRINLARWSASAVYGKRTDGLHDRDRAGRAVFRFDYKRSDLLECARFSLSHARGFCAGATEQIAAAGSTTACVQRTVRAAIDRAINLGTERSQHVTIDLAGGCGTGLMRKRSWDLFFAAAPPAGKMFGGAT